MNTAVALTCLALGLAVVLARSRTLALAEVTVQSLLIVGLAIGGAAGSADALPAVAGLVLRSVAVAAVFAVAIARTRERAPLSGGMAAPSRLLLAAVTVVAVPALVPALGIGDHDGQSSAVALAVLGIVIAATRRETLLQILGVIVAENGATLLAALSAPESVPAVIDLAVAFDLVLIVVVAGAFHTRIFGEFGTGDSAQMRGLHD